MERLNYGCCLCMTTGHFISFPKVWKSVTILYRVGHLVTQQTSSYDSGIIMIPWLKDKDVHKDRPLKDLQHRHAHTHMHTQIAAYINKKLCP